MKQGKLLVETLEGVDSRLKAQGGKGVLFQMVDPEDCLFLRVDFKVFAPEVSGPFLAVFVLTPVSEKGVFPVSGGRTGRAGGGKRAPPFWGGILLNKKFPGDFR